MDQEIGNGRHHSDESGDVIDLYNACNGEFREGLLDVGKLDDLSEGEREALDVARLRRVWEHIATGCARCEAIIETLSLAREVLGEIAEDPRPEPAAVVT